MYAKVRREFSHRHHARQVVFGFCHDVLSNAGRCSTFLKWWQSTFAELLESRCWTKPHLITPSVAKSINTGQEGIVMISTGSAMPSLVSVIRLLFFATPN